MQYELTDLHSLLLQFSIHCVGNEKYDTSTGYQLFTWKMSSVKPTVPYTQYEYCRVHWRNTRLRKLKMHCNVRKRAKSHCKKFIYIMRLLNSLFAEVRVLSVISKKLWLDVFLECFDLQLSIVTLFLASHHVSLMYYMLLQV